MHPDLPTSGGHLSHMFSGVGLPSSKLAAFPSTLKFTFRGGEARAEGSLCTSPGDLEHHPKVGKLQ